MAQQGVPQVESAVLDIPDLVILEYATAGELIKEFDDTWGQRPNGVALPLLCANGIPFENSFQEEGVTYTYAGTGQEIQLGEAAAIFLKEGLDIFLVVDPALPFARNEALHIIDIAGDQTPHACFGKESTRKIVKKLLEDGLKVINGAREEARNATTTKLSGVALDIVNLWPMGAEDQRIELTCFCRSCEEYFSSHSPKVDLDSFRSFPNPWNLVLKDTGTGIGHIHELPSSATANTILKLSELKGYGEELRKKWGERKLRQGASELLNYMRVRHAQTLSGIKDILTVSPRDVKRVILTEGLPYDWTSGTFLDLLITQSASDEIWFDPTAQAPAASSLPFRSYMWGRSRYIIDELFKFRASISDPLLVASTGLSRLQAPALKQQLERRRQRMMGAGLRGQLDRFCLPPLEQGRIGFVGVALTDNISKRLVEGLGSV